MESKIMIDINYASREPQIKILRKDSDDPRDTLVSMLAGEAMPGTNDGYCRIHRSPSRENDEQIIVITPIHPIEMIKHIPIIVKLAEENAISDAASLSAEYKKILESEYSRVFPEKA